MEDNNKDLFKILKANKDILINVKINMEENKKLMDNNINYFNKY